MYLGKGLWHIIIANIAQYYKRQDQVKKFSDSISGQYKTAAQCTEFADYNFESLNMFKLLPIVFLSGLAATQMTYTGCYNTTISTTTVEYCYGPDGIQTPLVTFATSTIHESVSATSNSSPSKITGCHNHGKSIYCINEGGNEVLISPVATVPPPQYTGCHSHGGQQYCFDPNGAEVLVVPESTDTHDSEPEMDCHFHAGVEHCVPVGQSEITRSCEKQDRSYNVSVRIGTLFAVLVTSAIGVFLPMLVERFATGKLGLNSLLFTVLKQFGTGVIIATAFVHLYTHASLMFNNECLGRLSYEATTSAIVISGIFICFVVEYTSHRFIMRYDERPILQTTNKAQSELHSTPHNQILSATGSTKLSITILEAGILFHSLILGLTLVVAGDSGYITLFVVIVFHQFFEGLALGSRIATIPSATFWPTKLVMGAAFALITPLGMAIGIGVLQRFNGNDPSTIIAVGTLNALSAGILIWVGVVEMWAADWVIAGGELVDAKVVAVVLGGVGLVAGLILMSVLGKWA